MMSQCPLKKKNVANKITGHPQFAILSCSRHRKINVILHERYAVRCKILDQNGMSLKLKFKAKLFLLLLAVKTRLFISGNWRQFSRIFNDF